MHLPARPLAHSPAHPHSHAHSLTHSPTQPLTHMSTNHSLVCTLIDSFTHSLIRVIAHMHTYIRFRTYSPTYSCSSYSIARLHMQSHAHSFADAKISLVYPFTLCHWRIPSGIIFLIKL